MTAYAPRLAGALAGVSGNRLGQWERHGLVRASVYAGPPANAYAPADVAEAIVVHWLLRRGFRIAEVHRAVAAARAEHRGWPLLEGRLGVARLAQSGDRGVMVRRAGEVWVAAADSGQEVLRPELVEVAGDLLAAGGWLAGELGLERIEVDPEVLGGLPVLRGRRWSLERVARVAADPPGRQALARDHGLEDGEIDEAVRWSTAAAALAEA